jgi:hypothetical protein
LTIYILGLLWAMVLVLVVAFDYRMALPARACSSFSSICTPESHPLHCYLAWIVE